MRILSTITQSILSIFQWSFIICVGVLGAILYVALFTPIHLEWLLKKSNIVLPAEVNIPTIHHASSNLFNLFNSFYLKGFYLNNIRYHTNEIDIIIHTIHWQPSHELFTGQVHLQGEISIPLLGIHLNKIHLEGKIHGMEPILFTGTVYSGAGKALINGTVNIKNSAFPVDITLQGQHLTAVHLRKLKIIISPDLKIHVNYPNVTIQGKIKIPRAKIRLKNEINEITLPDGVVFADEPQPDSSASFWHFLSKVDLNIILELDNDVYFTYQNLKTYLGGKLHILQTPNSLATAIGEIYAVKGNYTLYDQTLELKMGRLIYSGNLLTNPGLMIEATRKVDHIPSSISSSSIDPQTPLTMPALDSYARTPTIVGVRIRGTANNPQTSLFSIPAGLTQTQILSALGGQGAALFSALAELTPHTSGIGNFTGKLTNTLGLTEMYISSVQTFDSVTNQMQTTPSLIVGKQLSKKLSVHYSIGIFNPISIFNVRYQLNKHWAIQSENSSMDNGADILYGFEK